MNNPIFLIQQTGKKFLELRQLKDAISSVKDIFLGATGPVGRFITSRTNYYTHKLSIAHYNFKIAHPIYSRLADIISYTLKIGFDFITSPKVMKPVILLLAVIGFVLAPITAPALTVFILSIVGFAAYMHSDIKQKLHLDKTIRENDALKKIIFEKQKSVDLCKSLGITQTKMAEAIGLTTLTQRKAQTINLARIATSKLKNIPASHLNINAIKIELKRIGKTDPHRIIALKELMIQAKKVTQQNNELGYTGVGKGVVKAIRNSLGESLCSIILATYSTNPYLLTVGMVSTFANYIGGGIKRFGESNVRQAYKNTNILSRSRADIPTYNSLEDVEELAKTARLERKILKRLSNNIRFTQALRAKDYKTAKELVAIAKKELLIKYQLVKNDKEIVTINKRISLDIQKASLRILKELMYSKEYNTELNKLILAAKIEIIKEQLNRISEDKKTISSRKTEISQQITALNKCENLENLDKLLNIKKTELYYVYNQIDVRQKIDLLIAKTIQDRALEKARKEVLIIHQQQKEKQKQIEGKIRAHMLHNPNYSILDNDYKTTEHKSYWRRYWNIFLDNLNFMKPDHSFDGNPHELILDKKLQKFALIEEDNEAKKQYEQRKKIIPTILTAEVNLGPSIEKTTFLFRYIAHRPLYQSKIDESFVELNNLFYLQRSKVHNSSQHPSIFSPSNIVIFAEIGRFFGHLISYGFNYHKERKKSLVPPSISTTIDKETTTIKPISNIERPTSTFVTVSKKPLKQDVLERSAQKLAIRNHQKRERYQTNGQELLVRKH